MVRVPFYYIVPVFIPFFMTDNKSLKEKRKNKQSNVRITTHGVDIPRHEDGKFHCILCPATFKDPGSVSVSFYGHIV
jgi:hypothetical protein